MSPPARYLPPPRHRRRVRNTGLPHHQRRGFRTTAVGTGSLASIFPGGPLHRKSGPDGSWPTPEPPHRINQIFLDPLLAAEAASRPQVRTLNLTRVLGFTQNAEGVTAEVENLASSGKHLIECAYLVGCDGGSSMVRHGIGARLQGDAMIGRTQSSYIRAPGLSARMQAAPAWSTQVMNPRRSANMPSTDARPGWSTPSAPTRTTLRRSTAMPACAASGRRARSTSNSSAARTDQAPLLYDRFRDRHVHLRRARSHLGATRRLRHERRHRR